jgi:PBP1b-binding outer membrane lipoprotein LpoB
MKSMKAFSLSLLSLSAGLLLLAGCATEQPSVHYVDPNSQGKVAGTGIESQDVNAAAAQAAQSIINLQEIANAPTPPIIIIDKVLNKSSSPMDTSLYTSVLRDTLLNNAGGKVRFIDRSAAELNQKEQQLSEDGAVQGGAKRAALSYDYVLTAELQGIGMASSQGQSDYFRFTFKLISRKTDLLLWTNSYQIKKEGAESAVYR